MNQIIIIMIVNVIMLSCFYVFSKEDDKNASNIIVEGKQYIVKTYPQFNSPALLSFSVEESGKNKYGVIIKNSVKTDQTLINSLIRSSFEEGFEHGKKFDPELSVFPVNRSLPVGCEIRAQVPIYVRPGDKIPNKKGKK